MNCSLTAKSPCLSSTQDLTPLGIVEQLRRSGGAPPPAAGGW